MTRRYIQEAARLAPKKNPDGSYPIVVITEGVGSTGVYSPELMREDQAALFESAPSFMDHPIDPENPQNRSVLSIGGRVRNLRTGEDKGKAAILGDYHPRKEYAEFVEEFGDTLGLSIFSLANGDERDERGRLIVESFAEDDPYRSIDIVIAAGRGGRFKQAAESARAIESSLGTPEGNQPGSSSAPDHNKQEVQMEAKEVEAIVKSVVEAALAPINTFLAEEGARRQAEADALAERDDISEAVEAAVTTVEAVKAAKVLPKLEAKLIESAKKGVDVTADLEFAKEVTAEANVPAESGSAGYVHESAGYKASDFTLTGGRR